MKSFAKPCLPGDGQSGRVKTTSADSFSRRKSTTTARRGKANFTVHHRKAKALPLCLPVGNMGSETPSGRAGHHALAQGCATTAAPPAPGATCTGLGINSLRSTTLRSRSSGLRSRSSASRSYAEMWTASFRVASLELALWLSLQTASACGAISTD